MDKVQKIREEVEMVINRRLNLLNGDYFDLNKEADGFTNEIMDIINSLQEEPVSEDLEEAARNYSNNLDNICGSIGEQTRNAFKAGAQWQKEHLWKPADGDDLPDIDREVIVLYQPYPCEGNEYAVGFAHRPKEYWDGRNIETDEVTRYYPKRYDKGGWNSPNIKYWLDWELPIYRKGE